MKKALPALLGLSIVANLVLLYGSLDQAVTIDHHASQLKLQREQIEAAAKLFPPIVSGIPSAELIRRAKKEKVEILIKDKCTFYLGGILFKHRNGRVSNLAFDETLPAGLDGAGC